MGVFLILCNQVFPDDYADAVSLFLIVMFSGGGKYRVRLALFEIYAIIQPWPENLESTIQAPFIM